MKTVLQWTKNKSKNKIKFFSINELEGEFLCFSSLEALNNEENLEHIKNFLSSFSNNNPNKKIIIRPHPGEYSETWINFSKDKKNIEVVIDDKSTCSWIVAAKKCISSNCTTSVEGYLLNKISANYKVYEDEKVEFKLPKLMSCNIKNDDELINSQHKNIKYIRLEILELIF